MKLSKQKRENGSKLSHNGSKRVSQMRFKLNDFFPSKLFHIQRHSDFVRDTNDEQRMKKERAGGEQTVSHGDVCTTIIELTAAVS